MSLISISLIFTFLSSNMIFLRFSPVVLLVSFLTTFRSFLGRLFCDFSIWCRKPRNLFISEKGNSFVPFLTSNIGFNIGLNIGFNIGFNIWFNIGFQYWVSILGWILGWILHSILGSIWGKYCAEYCVEYFVEYWV